MRANSIPERDWLDTFKQFGFSERAAISYANMTRTVCEEDFPPADGTVHGTISLEEYVRKEVSDPQRAMEQG